MTATTEAKPQLSGKERRAIRAGCARLVAGVVVATPPRWSVGDVVTTRYTVPVPRTFGRRRWLFLLPGCRWRVIGVEDADRIDKRPTYSLRCVGERHEIDRKECRLKPVGATGGR